MPPIQLITNKIKIKKKNVSKKGIAHSNSGQVRSKLFSLSTSVDSGQVGFLSDWDIHTRLSDFHI